MITDVAAPDELPITPRRCFFPERVVHYGMPTDSFVRIVDVFDERGNVNRSVVLRAALPFIVISGTLTAD